MPLASVLSGRTQVREAVAAFLQTGIPTVSNPSPAIVVPHLSTVNAHPPKLTKLSDFYSAVLPGSMTGAVVFVTVSRQSERRVATGGAHSGRKYRSYVVHLLCYLRTNKVNAVSAGEDNDDFIDYLVSLIESDRNLANPAVIFQAGEGGEAGGPDLTMESLLPMTIDGGGSLVFTLGTLGVDVTLDT